MPWEISIRRGDGTTLGDRNEVKSKLALAFPGVSFYREPSGAEKIAACKKLGVDFPDVLRQYLERMSATEQGDFEGEGFSIRFFLDPTNEMISVAAEVRGDSDRAYPSLHGLVEATHWVVAEEGNPEPFIT